MKTENIHNEQSKRISSLALTKDDLKKLCEILQERADAAASLEVEHFKNSPIYTGSKKDLEFIKALLEGFKLNILLKGKDSIQLWGSIDEVFSSVNFPRQILSLHIDSEIPLKTTHNWVSQNGFKIFLDFNKPEIFDFTVLPGNETPNGSSFSVGGQDATWVNGVFHEVDAFIKQHSTSLNIIHKPFIYDVFIWIIILPFSFAVCSRLDGLFRALII